MVVKIELIRFMVSYLKCIINFIQLRCPTHPLLLKNRPITSPKVKLTLFRKVLDFNSKIPKRRNHNCIVQIGLEPHASEIRSQIFDATYGDGVTLKLSRNYSWSCRLLFCLRVKNWFDLKDTNLRKISHQRGTYDKTS